MKPKHVEILENILVPTDFSRGAQNAAVRAALIPLRPGAHIHLLHVLTRERARDTASMTEALRLLGKVAAAVTKHVQAQGHRPPAVTTNVLTGEPYVEIIRYARTVDADLIVLGRKGSGATVRKVLGTTAARVVRMSDVPTLLVNTRPTHPYRRPLVALSFDESARRLVRLVGSVSAPDLAVLHVVHAYRVPFQGFISAGSDERPTVHHRQFRDDAAVRFANMVKKLETNADRLKPALRRGDPCSVIVAEARVLRADLIALGTHGRSGIAHALLGSVAENVIISARRDVLVARPVRFTFEVP